MSAHVPGAAFDIRVEGLTRTFVKGEHRLEVLRGVDLEIGAGELVSIVGQSGSGKSTFLHILGTLDHPTSGRIWFAGRDVFARSPAELDALRNREIGFVFQFHHLLPDQDALHNVMMPSLIGGTPRRKAQDEAAELLTRVGLGQRLEHRPGELSGGEQQRVAIARAVAKRPDVLLCDEPTGALDSATGREVLGVLQHLNRSLGTTVMIVTHAAATAEMADRVIRFADGAIRTVEHNDAPRAAAEIEW